MPRVARIKSRSGLYHVVFRGINKQTVFYDDEDKEVFLNRLKLAKERYGFELYAFCFMNNHVHLLVKEKEADLGIVMNQLLTSYVFWYNSKYERIGSLFQSRYKSETIEDEAYLLCAARYIHQNPVKARIVKDVSEYKWSSYGAYLHDKKSIIDKELILAIFQSREQYIEFMNMPEANDFIEPTEQYKISDDKLIKEIKKRLKMQEISELYELSKADIFKRLRRILQIEGTNPTQVARVCGIPRGIIRGMLRK